MTFDEFLTTELDGLRRYARLIAGSRNGAHDLLAETLIKAHLRWGKIGRLESPASYVRAMVLNGLRSDRRRWSSRFVHTTSSGELPDSPTPSGSTVVDDRDQLDQLLRSLHGNSTRRSCCAIGGG